MADRYNSIDNTSPILKSMQDEKPNVKRSAFDYGNTVVGQLFLGASIPIDLIRFVPNEDFEVSYDLNIISRNPLLRKILTSQRCYVHTYIQYDRNLWEGARNQKTNGYSGNINLQTPCLKINYPNKSTSNAFSLSTWLGVSPLFYNNSDPLTAYTAVNISNLVSSGIGTYEINKIAPNETINALPFVMYQQICRDKIFNANVLYENKNWYPDNQDHFILPYEIPIDESTQLPLVNVLDYNNPLMSDSDFEALDFSADGKVYVPTNDNDGSSPVVLDSLHFRQRKGDRFTTALPFPDLIRGDIPYIDMSLVASSEDLVQEVTSTVTGSVNGSGLTIKGSFASTGNTNSSGPKKINLNNSLYDYIEVYGDSQSATTVVNALNNSYKASGTLSLKNGVATGSFNVQDLASKIIASSLSLNDIRTLQAYTIFKERNALAKGDYNSLIEAQFGFNPSVQEREPIYVGGFYQDILFSEVTQTSQSDSSSQLGQKSSNAYSNSSGYIGKFKARDFGYMMTILSIVPDSFYTQGLSPEVTQTYQDEVYFPILNELPPQAILNKELFTSGNASVDNDVLAYTERYSEYKSRQNRVTGLSALGQVSEYDSALIQKNVFSETPVFNNQFLTLSPKNIDMSIYSVYNEPPYDYLLRSRVDRVGPFPYTTLPKGVI